MSATLVETQGALVRVGALLVDRTSLVEVALLAFGCISLLPCNIGLEYRPAMESCAGPGCQLLCSQWSSV